MVEEISRQFRPEILVSRRFLVPCLPLWSLSGVRSYVGDVPVLGIGFDKSRQLSIVKAQSECLERAIFRHWEVSSTNPFTGESEAPYVAAGMAVNLNEESAVLKAREETVERIVLAKIDSGECSLKKSERSQLGIVSQFLQGVFGIELEVFEVEVLGEGYFSFATVDLSKARGGYRSPGFLFGSAFSARRKISNRAAAEEAVRKLAFVKAWLGPSSSNESTYRLMRFWLSDSGRKRVQDFVGIGRSDDGVSLRISVPLNCVKSMKVGHLWAASCMQYDYPLPDPLDLRVPLV